MATTLLQLVLAYGTLILIVWTFVDALRFSREDYRHAERMPRVAWLTAIGFCFGGAVSNMLAVRLGSDLSAAVPFYGGQPPAADAAKAIAALNDKEYQQRTLKVREANDKRDKEEREGSETDA